MRIKTRKRFWSKVDKGPKCWVWTASKDTYGYGGIRVNGNLYGAHRFSYEMKYGSIPGGLCVLHKCDNPPCVRPSHLFLGTRKDNMIDRDTKGRVNKGVSHPFTKLTELQVKAIRKDTRLQKDIAKDYNIDQSAISLIKTRKTWKHVR